MNRRQRQVFAAVSVLLGISAGANLLKPFLPESVAMLTAVPTRALISGLALMLGLISVSALRSQSSVTTSPAPLVRGPPPERPQKPPARTGAAFDTTVSEAAREVRVKQVDSASTVPRNRLRQTAITIVETTRKCERDKAETLVSAGDWTTNPVAQTFLSDDGEYPLLFRVVWWARPELAYTRAVSQTVAELRARAEAGVPGYLAEVDQTERASDGATSDAVRTLWTRFVELILVNIENIRSRLATETEPSGDDTIPSKQSMMRNDDETPPATVPEGGRDE